MAQMKWLCSHFGSKSLNVITHYRKSCKNNKKEELPPRQPNYNWLHLYIRHKFYSSHRKIQLYRLIKCLCNGNQTVLTALSVCVSPIDVSQRAVSFSAFWKMTKLFCILASSHFALIRRDFLLAPPTPKKLAGGLHVCMSLTAGEWATSMTCSHHAAGSPSVTSGFRTQLWTRHCTQMALIGLIT